MNDIWLSRLSFLFLVCLICYFIGTFYSLNIFFIIIF